MTPLLGAAATVAACYALGAYLIRRLGIVLKALERFPLALVLGAACLHLAVFVVLALKIAWWPVVVGLLGAALFAGRHEFRFSWKRPVEPSEQRWELRLAPLLFVPFALLAFFHAWAPESSADGAGYHLGLVARFFLAHGFERITTNMYASLSGGMEMLFLPAYIIGRHSAAALVHFAFAIALALAMIAYGRRIGKPWVGVAGAFFTFASPVAGVDGASAYNDVAVAAVAFSVFYWLELWDEKRANALLIPAGVVAGYGYAVKYTAFVVLVYAVGFVIWRSRNWKPAMLVMACAIPMFAPWMLKDWAFVSNPVAPLGNVIFRNPYIHISFERTYNTLLRRYGVANRWTLPLEVIVRGDKTGGVIGPLFLFAPLALLALRQRPGRRLLAMGTLLLATFYFNVSTRFLIPCLPFVSLAIALALDFSPPLLLILMLFHAITSWPEGIRVYARPAVWSLNRMLYREALRIVPQDTALREASDSYSLARMVEFNVPKGERVLTLRDLALAYTTRDVMVGFESAFGEDLQDILNTGWNDDQQPSIVRTFRFPPVQTRGVRLISTSASARPFHPPWGVDELRFYNHGTELARHPDWRLQAWPNPWDVQMAFDNSPATRWRTWEPVTPGMYLQAELPAPQTLDQVNVETCPDDAGVDTEVQVRDDRGQWHAVAAEASESRVPVRPDIRRAAVYELHRRNVNYLLLNDSDAGSEEIRDDPEYWGLKEIAAGFGARIYKVIL